MLVKLVRDDLLAGAEVLAEAFHEDPMFSFLFPEPAQRRKWLRLLMGSFLHESLPDQHVFGVRRDGALAGVMALIPPGRFPIPASRTLGFFLSRRRPPLTRPTLHLARRGIPVLMRMLERHPATRHLYVYAIGIHPSHQGKGLGRILLEVATHAADVAGVAAYLETAKPENVAIYRRFGFEVTTEESFPGAPPLWTMTRPAP